MDLYIAQAGIKHKGDDTPGWTYTSLKQPLKIREKKPLDRSRLNFLAIVIQDVITCVKFSDDQVRGLGLVWGQSLPLPMDFAGRLYNSAMLLRVL